MPGRTAPGAGNTAPPRWPQALANPSPPESSQSLRVHSSHLAHPCNTSLSPPPHLPRSPPAHLHQARVAFAAPLSPQGRVSYLRLCPLTWGLVPAAAATNLTAAAVPGGLRALLLSNSTASTAFAPAYPSPGSLASPEEQQAQLLAQLQARMTVAQQLGLAGSAGCVVSDVLTAAGAADGAGGGGGGAGWLLRAAANLTDAEAPAALLFAAWDVVVRLSAAGGGSGGGSSGVSTGGGGAAVAVAGLYPGASGMRLRAVRLEAPPLLLPIGVSRGARAMGKGKGKGALRRGKRGHFSHLPAAEGNGWQGRGLGWDGMGSCHCAVAGPATTDVTFIAAATNVTANAAAIAASRTLTHAQVPCSSARLSDLRTRLSLAALGLGLAASSANISCVAAPDPAPAPPPPLTPSPTAPPPAPSTAGVALAAARRALLQTDPTTGSSTSSSTGGSSSCQDAAATPQPGQSVLSVVMRLAPAPAVTADGAAAGAGALAAAVDSGAAAARVAAALSAWAAAAAAQLGGRDVLCLPAAEQLGTVLEVRGGEERTA